ncbi:MAG: hypothetical protein PHY18_01895 [Dehalococcoidales bacterium]|nr:hypothetical protein [Dehalococcoidales bacterium]
MFRGCISLGDVRCDECQRIIPHSGHYLIIEDEGSMKRLCQHCSLDKGYAHYKEEKGERVLTFFSE